MEDEFFHRPGPEEFWSESHYLDFVGDGLAGQARIGFYPNRDRANLWVYLNDGEGYYGLRDEDIPLGSVHGLTVRRGDWEFAMLPAAVGREWTVEFEGTAARYGSPAEILADGGEPCDLSLSLTTAGRHEPFLFSRGAWGGGDDGSDRYEQATRVEGEATVDGRRREFSGPGERDHSWGRRKWAGDTEWLWISGAFEDGTAYNHVSAWAAGTDERSVNGFWFDGGDVHALTDAGVAATPAFGTGTAREWADGDAPRIDLSLEWEGGGAEIEVDPFATTPIDWVDRGRDQRGLLNRSPARQEKDGVAGRGFLENMTQLPP